MFIRVGRHAMDSGIAAGTSSARSLGLPNWDGVNGESTISSAVRSGRGDGGGVRPVAARVREYSRRDAELLGRRAIPRTSPLFRRCGRGTPDEDAEAERELLLSDRGVGGAEGMLAAASLASSSVIRNIMCWNRSPPSALLLPPSPWRGNMALGGGLMNSGSGLKKKGVIVTGDVDREGRPTAGACPCATREGRVRVRRCGGSSVLRGRPGRLRRRTRWPHALRARSSRNAPGPVPAVTPLVPPLLLLAHGDAQKC